MSDARFEDAQEAPLNLGALDGEDLKVLSTLCQDAVFTVADMTWRPRERRFAMLLNRFRWEHKSHAPERVRSVLAFDDVMQVASQGINRSEQDVVLSLLSIEFVPGKDGTGDVTLTLAGDGGIKLSVEALGATLKDVTRPYRAPSGRTPSHEGPT